MPPYWTQWDGDTNAVTVSIQPANQQYEGPNCNIVGGKMSKIITFTDNPTAPPVSK